MMIYLFNDHNLTRPNTTEFDWSESLNLVLRIVIVLYAIIVIYTSWNMTQDKYNIAVNILMTEIKHQHSNAFHKDLGLVNKQSN